MPLPEFGEYAPARLLQARPAAAEQHLLHVEPPPGFREAHTRPGQFCRLRVGGLEGIFSMISSPGEPPRFLLRTGLPGRSAADALAALPDGAPLEMSPPAGEGFGLERARGRDLRFVATGTGVAPIAAAIEHVLAERARYGAISLDHGLRSEAHLAIGPALDRWREAGVEVRLAYSTPDEEGRLQGASVLDTLRAAAPSLAGAAVIGAGQPAMIRDLRALVAELGGDPALLLTNY